MESPGAYVIKRASRFMSPGFFRTAFSCSGGYHLKMDEMPLRDVVGINCKKGATTESQMAGAKYMG